MSNETTTRACPECDCAEFRVRSGNSLHGKQCETKYQCRNPECEHEFDEAVRRPVKNSGSVITAKQMLERLGVDPDEAMVGGDD